MSYDYRNRANQPYDSQIPMYKTTTSSSTSAPGHQLYGAPMYPRVSQPSFGAVPPPGRASSYQQTSAPSSSPGLGIRVVIKPEFRISPPPQLSPQVGEIPRSTFQFDFDLEKKILAEAEKDSQNWSRLGLENLPSKALESTPSMGSTADPVVSKYIASGLSREAVPLAVANYGDNETKVREFTNGYTLLREMGFSSSNVAEALVMYDNDTDKALAHFLNSSS
ncbi:hypothetical protein AAG906_008726 [Vitis piasezkii]